MKLVALKAFAIAAITVCAFSSCKKDKDKPASISIEGLSGSYKMVASTSKVNNGPEIDIYTQKDACEKDDIVKLNKDKTYVYQDAGTKCVFPGDDTGYWDLPSTTRFVIDGQEAVLDSFDGKVLKVTFTDTWGSDTEVIRTTFNKQ